MPVFEEDIIELIKLCEMLSKEPDVHKYIVVRSQLVVILLLVLVFIRNVPHRTHTTP